MSIENKELSAKTRYNLQYAKTKIKRVPLDMQIDDYEALKGAAAAAGEKINTYIKKAITERMERESRAGGDYHIDPQEIPDV